MNGKKKSLVFGLILLGSIFLVESQTLRSLAERHGKYFGTAVSSNLLNSDQASAQLVNREFDVLTPDNEMKWDTTERSRGQFNFGPAERIVSNAQQHGQKVRGHTLVWHSQLPQWVSSGHFSKSELHNIMKAHVTGEATHWKGKLYAWDVVNEAFNEDGSFRSSVFYNTLGKEFIADALRFAHEADPTAKLYINDYNVEGVNQKSNALYALAQELKHANVPLHGIGLQAHFTAGAIPHDLQRNMERFAALGLDVAITELDIRIHMPADASKLAQQAKDYEAVVKACLAVSRCVGITVWGVTDKDSWVPSVFHDYGAALLFDQNHQEKPAFAAVKRALN